MKMIKEEKPVGRWGDTEKTEESARWRLSSDSPAAGEERSALVLPVSYLCPKTTKPPAGWILLCFFMTAYQGRDMVPNVGRIYNGFPPVSAIPVHT